MPNLTMKIDEKLLKKTRKRAIDKNSSLTALVRKYLEKLAGEEDLQRQAVIAELETAFEANASEIGPITWTRGDLHER